MEEAKHANGDDSALGAYDVWSTSGKGGYKGVNIHGGIEASSSSSAKVGGERKEVVQAGALSKGKGMVAFKKRKMIVTNSSSAAAAEEGKGVKTGSTNFMFSKKMNKKKKHRRTTFADDD
eukprot:12264839-Ditylum_brightwellii.AAC.1